MKVQKLSSLVPEDIFIGTSLVLYERDRFLFGIRPRKFDRGRAVFELTGIGGGIEEYDASYSAGARREALEEIRCPVTITPSEQTLVVRNVNDIEQVSISGDERPLAIVFRNHRTPAHRPWHPVNEGSACQIIFHGVILGQPVPTMELPYLIWIKPEQIRQTARRDLQIGDLLAKGGVLVASDYGTPPKDGWARLTDSQEALAIALGDEAIDFYSSLFEAG
jgi:hypothetical protein